MQYMERRARLCYPRRVGSGERTVAHVHEAERYTRLRGMA
ncbi:MAG: hypothetical protein OJF50_006146 [Nitrospira sp.]|nr:hypothetical protein [Nitrospira sp.]